MQIGHYAAHGAMNMSVMRVIVSQIAHVGIMHCSDTDNFLQILQKVGPRSSYMCTRNLSRMSLTVYFKFIEIKKYQFSPH